MEPESQSQNWVRADKEHVWHPFTDHERWCAPNHEPLVLVKGEGVYLYDACGRRYIDANSSIWTNIHGHTHPHITKAIQHQAAKVAHTSYLGFANPRASELAGKLVAFFPDDSLSRVFFSDNGSTAVECALKMAIQYRQITGEQQRRRFVAFHNAYHGDTMGAASLGGVSTFFERFRSFGFPVDFVANLEALKELDATTIAGVIIEPLVQGVNQMHVWPSGMLTELKRWCDQEHVHLILDEVMTGFGRTGSMFACQQEEVIPDFLCLAKGLTGGCLPLAATMVREEIFNEFKGSADKVFYYGHSYTGNQLGCAAALANLEVFEQEQTLVNVHERSRELQCSLQDLSERYSSVISVRSCGLIAGLRIGTKEGKAFDPSLRMGERFCERLREFGVLTRPILDTIVIMPPLSITRDQLQDIFDACANVLESFAYGKEG